MVLLNPSCSEQVFRLVGDLAEIKQQVLNMLDAIEGEGYVPLKVINEKREEVRKVKDLGDFNLMCFEFTTNYETFFKATDNDDLIVATCNNTSWNNVDYIDESPDDYFKIANYDYFIIMLESEDYVVTESKYKEKKIRYFLERVDGGKFEKLEKDWDNTLKIVKRKGNLFIASNRLIEVKEVKDKDKLDEINARLFVLKL